MPHFTPEYSSELSHFVLDLYQHDIKHHYPKLKLQKLINLLENCQLCLETYKGYSLGDQGNERDALTAFIIGAFYLFLIIPNSIQYNSKNKNFSIYLELKKMYQDELNMSNVLDMVIRTIERASDRKHLASVQEGVAETQPHGSLEPPVGNNGAAHNSLRKRAYSVSVIDTGKTMSAEPVAWKAPNLEPDDHLQLLEQSAIESARALGHTSSSSSGNNSLDGEVFTNSPRSLQHNFMPESPRQPGAFGTESLDAVDAGEIYKDADRIYAHRKDSYHSIYVDGYEDSFNRVMRLYHASVINHNELLKVLQTDQRSLLVFDIRATSRFEVNRIECPYIINIRPSVLLQGAKTLRELEGLLHAALPPRDFDLFKRRDEFRHVVYYSDIKSFLAVNSQIDYLLVFFQCLAEDKVLPQLIPGGFDSWTRFVSKYCESHNVTQTHFVLQPRTPKSTRPESPVGIVGTGRSSPLPIVPSGKAPVVPVAPHRAHTAPAIPVPRRPPPPPVQYPPQVPSHQVPPLPRQQPPPPPMPHRQTPMVPTIQQSDNPLVSMSITGLRNCGNTCYINAMIQCLFRTPRFRDIFITNKYEKYLGNNYTKPYRISQSFHALFSKMYLNGGCSVVPSGFLKTCNLLRPDLKIPSEQQDTQEFLLFLLDQLHDELNDPVNVAQDYPQLLLHDDMKLHVDEKEYDKWFEENLKQGLSPIDDIFQGQLENSLQCGQCGFTSYNYATFFVLSLAVPNSSTFRSKVSLEDCINLYTNDEVLTGDNCWDCPKCKPKESKESKESKEPKDKERRSRAHRFFRLRSSARSESPAGKLLGSSKNTSTKSLNFIASPPILVIHLSRFRYDLTKKNTTSVVYPVYLNIVLKNNTTARYKLFGVVNHFGNLISGHYTAVVNKSTNSKDSWYYFDDENARHDPVMDKGKGLVASSDAYVLFYERI